MADELALYQPEMEAPDCPSTKRRPKLFRALGNQDPPAEIEVDDKSFRRVKIFKHDSWAATALYECDDSQIVCKFNRIQPVFGIWFGWLGRLLARRERRMYERLQDLDNTPRSVGTIKVSGRVLPHAVGHEYIPGHPLCWHDRLNDEFFPKLSDLLDEMHKRGIAYVDFHKRENIIVGRDGQPYLIDFQISAKLPRLWPLSLILGALQKADRYHFEKHVWGFRPDLLDPEQVEQFERRRPFWINLHRTIARPLRELRRRLLVLLRVRSGKGKADTESSPEEARRNNIQEDTPLLRLHNTLVSDEYFHCHGDTFKTYVLAVFKDLYGRIPESRRDHTDVRRFTAGKSRHQVVAALLRQPEVFQRSRGLEPQWTESLNRQIRIRLREESTRADPAPARYRLRWAA